MLAPGEAFFCRAWGLIREEGESAEQAAQTLGVSVSPASQARFFPR